jgi:hypothetical protein
VRRRRHRRARRGTTTSAVARATPTSTPASRPCQAQIPLPIGVELLGLSHGVDLTDLPQRANLARLLAEAHLPGWDAA